MAVFFGATLFFGVTTALCVPYLYAYCKQSSNVTVQESDVTEKEEESETKEDVLTHSLRIKEQEGGSLEISKTKIMKDASINTIETMASDATSYKELATIRENYQEEQVLTKTSGPITVQAVVHAKNPNSETFTKETAFNTVNKANLLRKKLFSKNEKPTERLKRLFTGVRGFSKPSSSEDLDKMYSVSTGSSPSQGIRTNTGINSEGNNSTTSKLQNQPRFAHSTLRDSKQKLAPRFHEVNGSPTCLIELPSGSTTSLTISVSNLSSPGHLKVSQPQNKTFRVIVQQTACSSDEDTDLNEKFSFSRFYKSLPGRLRITRNEVKENPSRSSVF